jgi:hypothetical protein
MVFRFPLALPWIVVFGLLTSLGVAAPSTEDQQRATDLFKEGRAAMSAKDYDTACAKFAESQRLLPARGTLLNLAVCRETRGDLAQALEAYDAVIADLPPGDERSAFAQDKADALRSRVPALTLELSPDLPSETSVARDGVGLSSSDIGKTMRLDPGEHIIEVRVPGREDRRYHVRLVEGDDKKLVLEAGPLEGLMEKDVPSSAPADDRGMSPLMVGGIALGSLGVAAVVVGAVTGGLAIEKKSVVDRDCGPASCRTQEGIDAAASGSTLASVSTATFVIGGAAIATGVFLVLLGLDGGPSESTAFIVVAAPEGAGLSLSGRF